LSLLEPSSILSSIAVGLGTTGSSMAAGSEFGYGIGWLIALSAAGSVLNLYISTSIQKEG